MREDLKRPTDRWDFMRSSIALHTRTKEANGLHRIKSASEWNIQIGARSCGVAVSVLNRGKKKRRDDLGKKVVNELKYEYPGMKFINIRDSES